MKQETFTDHRSRVWEVWDQSASIVGFWRELSSGLAGRDSLLSMFLHGEERERDRQRERERERDGDRERQRQRDRGSEREIQRENISLVSSYKGSTSMIRTPLL